MKRIAVCVACNAQKNGVRSRIAFEHTCGNDPILCEKIPQHKGKLFPGEGAFQVWLKKTSVLTIDFVDGGQDLQKIWVDEFGEILHCDLQTAIWNGKFINMDNLIERQPIEMHSITNLGFYSVMYNLIIEKITKQKAQNETFKKSKNYL